MKSFLAKYKIIMASLIIVTLGIIIELIFFNLHRFSNEFHEFLIRFVVFGVIFTLSVIIQYYSNYSRQQIQSNEKFEIESYNESGYQRLLGKVKYKIIIFGLICGIIVAIIELLVFGNHEFPHKVHEILTFIMSLGVIFTLSVVLQYYSKQQIKSVQKLIESEHNLGERVKELTCLYGLSKLVENPEISQEAILQGTLDLILPAWQFPEITCARIYFDNKEFKTSNFKETEWKLSTNVIVNEKVMMIEVYYLEDKPFLKEEESLLDDLGKRLKNFFEIKVAIQKLLESEERLQKFMDSATDSFILFDSELNYIDVNEVSQQLVAKSKEELIGKNILDIVPYIKETERYDKYLEVINTGIPFSTEDVIYNSVDGILSVYLSVRAFKVGDGLGIISTDITERKKNEKEIIDLAQFPSENPYPVLRVSRNGFMYINDAGQKLLNLVDSDQIPDIFQESVKNTFESNQISKSEVEFDNRVYSFTITPVKDHGYVNIYGMDVTERKHREENLKEINELKSEFLRRASHELKTPLISIKGFSELILSLHGDQLETSIISKLREINDGCERLQNIINNLLKTSRLESPDLKPNVQKEDLSFL
ncbi:hypothetical protein LCGC14_1787330, partial [marine sediment metagenome]